MSGSTAKNVVASIPLGFAVGAISGAIVFATAFLFSATIGACGVCCKLDGSAWVLDAIAGVYGAAYGAIIGVILVAIAAVVLPKALARTSGLRLILFLVTGAFVGSIFSWIFAPSGHTCGEWAPVVVKGAQLGAVHLYYKGPHLSVVLFTALWFFAGLGGAPRLPKKTTV